MELSKVRLSSMSNAAKRAMAKKILKKQEESAQKAQISKGKGPRPEHTKFELFPEYASFKKKLELGKNAMKLKNNPYLLPHEGVSADTITVYGKEYINFSGYNYLGLSGDSRINHAVQEAVERFGTSASASRLVGGEITLHGELEKALADLLGVEDCVTYVSGWGTNVASISQLFRPGDLILHDELMHNSLFQGAKLSGARRMPFPHNDFEAVDELLEKHRNSYERVLVVVEGVYSMDGDYPNVPKFIEVKNRHKAFLMIDEAHSAGTMGETGRGIGEHFGINPKDVDIWMGTLSKSFVSCGGYIAGNKALCEQLKFLSSGFVYSVGLSPALTAASLKSVQIMLEEPHRVKTLQARSKQFKDTAESLGLDTGLCFEGTPVVPIIVGSSYNALKISDMAMEAGINVKPLLYPAVADEEARLRFFITASHTEEQIDLVVRKIADLAFEIGVKGAKKGNP